MSYNIFDNPTHFNQLVLLSIIAVFFFTLGIYYLLKYPNYQKTFSKAFILLIIVLICANGVRRSLQYSDELWDRDKGSEISFLNAASSFADKGFAVNAALPDYSWRYYYLDKENDYKLNKTPPTRNVVPDIYTHTPPASSWLIGLFVKVCGTDTLSCPRILSTITSSLALLFFAIMAYHALGPLKCTVLMFFVAVIPMTKNMVHTLHYHNYAFSLFLILSGYLLYLFKKKCEFKMSTAIILFILAFIQGWMAYDYFALTLLSPISFALLYSPLDNKEDRRRLFLAMLSCALGFLFAAGLHFIQNSIYFGSIMEAYTDIYDRLHTRSLSKAPETWSREVDRVSLSLEYFFLYPRSWVFFIINFPILFIVCLVLIWFKDISITIKEPINITLKWISPRRNYFVILSAVITSYLFIFVLFNAVANEAPHMARILFFSYFICILTMIECIRSVVPTDK